MRIIAIVGSPRRQKSNTYLLTKRVLDEAKIWGAETETIFLSELDINFCRGCLHCIPGGECSIKDDVASVQDKMFQAVGIIFASPTYVQNVSGQMKTFIDRCCSFVHRRKLEGKYGAAVTVFGGGIGEHSVRNYLMETLQFWGVTTVGSIYAQAGAPGEFYDSEDAFEQAILLGRDLIQAIKGERKYQRSGGLPRLGQIAFGRFLSQRKKIFKEDYQFWKERGWL